MYEADVFEGNGLVGAIAWLLREDEAILQEAIAQAAANDDLAFLWSKK